MVNKNFKLQGKRNFAMGRIASCVNNLANINSDLLTTDEVCLISSAMHTLQDVFKNREVNQKLFAKNNNFKNSKIDKDGNK